MIAPRALDAESESRAESLRRALSRSDGFGLFLVLAEGAAQAEIVRRIQAWAEMSLIPHLEVFPAGVHGASQLRERVTRAESSAAGWLVPDGDALFGTSAEGLLEALNLTRDRLWQIVKGPLVLVMSPRHAVELQARAADLYDVRRGTWQLRVVASERIGEIAVERAEPMPLEKVRELLARLDEDERAELGQPSAWVDQRVSIAQALLSLGDSDGAITQAQHAERVARSWDYTSGVAAALNVQASIAIGRGEHDLADSLLHASLEHTGESGEIPERTYALLLQVNLTIFRGDLGEAERLLRERLEFASRVGSRDLQASLWRRLARVQRLRGEAAAALETLHSRAIPLLEELADPTELAGAWMQVADIQRDRGILQDAEDALEREVLPRLEKGADLQSLAWAAVMLGDIHEYRGRFDEALRLHREVALPIFERLGDERHRALTLGRIADVLMGQGEIAAAFEIRVDQELPAFERLGDTREAAITRLKLARILLLGRPNEARAMLREHVIPAFVALGDAVETANARAALAMTLAHTGDPESAIELLSTKVIPVLRDRGEADHLSSAEFDLASALASVGRSAEASRLLRERVLPVMKQIGDVSSLRGAQSLLDRLEARPAVALTPRSAPRNRRERRAARRRGATPPSRPPK